MYLVFEVFQDTWCSNKENPSVYWGATLSCPLMASNDSNSYLAPISFWSRSGCWPCLGFCILSRFTCVYISFCSVSDKSGAPLFSHCSQKKAVAHMFAKEFVEDYLSGFQDGFFRPVNFWDSRAPPRNYAWNWEVLQKYCELFLPLQSPGSLRGGYPPRKLGKNTNCPPGPTTDNGEKNAEKLQKILWQYTFYDFR